MAEFDDEADGYTGPARLLIGEDEFEVSVDLRGYFQPIDGRFHWYGRVAAHAGLSARLGGAKAAATLTTPGGAARCDLAEPDTWDRYRITGTGAPPFAVAAELPADTRSDTQSVGGSPEPVLESVLPTHVRVAVIGSGFGGLGAGVRLREAGIRDFVILERADSVGGTWRDNTYPGCACDVPSHLYSFSFAPNPRWSRSFSKQPEIRAYLEGVADRFALRRHLYFGSEVREARWDAGRSRWRLQTARGELTADVLISAAGPLSDPVTPDIPGIAEFPGEIFHSARWNHAYQLAGKRVAVVGTGASAIQLVPEIQPQVDRLVLFQRTPAWVLPRADRRITGAETWLFEHVPVTQRLARLGIYSARESSVGAFTKRPALLKAASQIARRHLRKAVADPGLRAKLTPGYTMGCKRILLSSDYYPALARPNVQVVASGLAKIDGNTLIAQDGSAHEVDAVVFATGFHTADVPIADRVYGADGRTLAEAWRGDMRALRGTVIAGFPNLCLVIGPNTGLGHNSMVQIIESQLRYIVDYVKTLDRTSCAALDSRAEAQQAWCDAVERRMGRTVWATGGCVSWYLNAAGRNPTLWPASTIRFRRALRRVDLSEYDRTESGATV
jgi:cation diffusion facilitator CzcD-associated flavoprotein CzcO